MLAVLYNFPHKTAKGKTTDDWSWTDKRWGENLYEITFVFQKPRIFGDLIFVRHILALVKNSKYICKMTSDKVGRRKWNDFDPIAQQKPRKTYFKRNLAKGKIFGFFQYAAAILFYLNIKFWQNGWQMYKSLLGLRNSLPNLKLIHFILSITFLNHWIRGNINLK